MDYWKTPIIKPKQRKLRLQTTRFYWHQLAHQWINLFLTHIVENFSQMQLKNP